MNTPFTKQKYAGVLRRLHKMYRPWSRDKGIYKATLKCDQLIIDLYYCSFVSGL